MTDDTIALPPKPEPWSARSKIKCKNCGADYRPPMTIAPMASFGMTPSHACECGCTTFQGTFTEGCSPAVYTLAQLKAYAREAVRLYIAGRVGAVPAGWLITIEGDNALVRAPIDGPGGTTVAKYHGNLQGRVLFALAHALAAAPKTPLDAQGDER